MQKGTSFFTGKASEDIATTSVRTSSTDFEYRLRGRTSSTDFEYGLQRIRIHMEALYRHAKPGIRHAKPGARHAKPGTRHAKPGTRHAKPGGRWRGAAVIPAQVS